MSKYFHFQLFRLQIKFFTAVIVAVLATTYIFENSSVHISPEKLKVNVNTADKYQLISVPYIGKKTAEKIIRIREKNGQITDLNQLKNLRYYKRFKYFLKVK